jgi:hypothetical protein
MLGKVLKFGGYAGAAYAASGVLSRAFANENDGELSDQDKAGKRGEITGQTTAAIAGGLAGKVAGKAIGAIGGRLAGMAMGAAMGSFIPVVGTVLGGLAGMALGSVLAEPMGNMGEGIGRRIQANNAGANAAMAEQAQYDPMTGMQIGGFASATPSLLREPAYAALSNPAAANNAQSQAALEALKQPTKVELQPSQMTIKIDAPEGYSATAQLSSPTFKLDGGSTSPWARN